MKPAIEKIIYLVTSTHHPDNAVKLDLSDNRLRSLLDTASLEIKTLLSQLVDTVFNSNKDTDIESHVQNYQSVIIKLLDDLYSYQLTAAGNSKLIELYTTTSFFLSNMLSYIEKYFSKYFNLDENLPMVSYSIVAKDFEEQLNKLIVLLREKGVEQQFIDIVLLPFSKFKSNQRLSLITYRYLIYLKELLCELTEISMHKKGEDINSVIRNQLIYLNFNDPAFLNAVINKISNETKGDQNLNEKILKLKFNKKEINQINIKPGAGLHKDIMPVKRTTYYMD